DVARALQRRQLPVPIVAFWNDRLRHLWKIACTPGIDLQVFSSHALAARAVDRGLAAARARVLKPWCDDKDFDPARTAAGRLRAHLPLSHETPLAAAIEPLESAHRRILLARAFARIQAHWGDPNSPPHFVFLGSGSLEGQVRSECKRLGLGSSVHFFSPEVSYREALRDLDLAIWSSLRPGVPQAVLEALAMSVPVIAPKNEAMTELV